MTYQAELDDRPHEIRRGYAGNDLPFWPKVSGVGNVAIAGSATYSLFKPSGDLIALGLPATATLVGSPNVTRLDLRVDASNTATYQLGERYRADVLFTYDGREQLRTVRFSVALEPYTPDLSLNDFEDEVADSRQILEGQASEILEGRTPEQHASVLAVRAWVDVYRWLENRLRNEGRIMPRLIIDRWKIEQVVIAQAVYRMYRAEGTEEGTRVGDRTAYWKREALSRFEGLGELAYDQDEDQVADTTLRATVQRKLERSW
jgi:hypothetical protein